MRLPRLLRTASFRLAGFYAVVFAASVLALGGVVRLRTRTALEQGMRARIEGEVAAFETELREDGLPQLARLVDERNRSVRGLDYLLEAPGGERLAGDLPTPAGQLGWLTLRTPRRGTRGDGYEEAMALAVRLPGGALLVVGDDLGRVEDVDEAVLIAFGWGLVLTVLLAVGGGLLLSAGFLRRVDAIARTAEAIVEGDLGQRVPVRGTDDDLDRLARTLNRMLDRIGELMEGLRQVSSEVAHELRTPLTRLRQRLETARAGARSVEDFQQVVEGAIAETDGVLEIFAALLRIAQIEAGTRRAAFAPLDLAEVAGEVVEAFAPSAEEEGKALSLRAAPAPLRGDRELLTQMVANLIENGIRHTPAGTRVDVAVGPVAGGARLVVADDGPGVPEAERGRLAQRFYRLERSRGREGNGLGLSLVAAVADLHGARLSFDDNRPGLRVALQFGAREAATP